MNNLVRRKEPVMEKSIMSVIVTEFNKGITRTLTYGHGTCKLRAVVERQSAQGVVVVGFIGQSWDMPDLYMVTWNDMQAQIPVECFHTFDKALGCLLYTAYAAQRHEAAKALE